MMVCPLQIGDVLPAGGAPLLWWVDGTASGYRLKTIKLDNPAQKVLFKVESNGQ